MALKVGKGPNQIPVCGMLGKLAFLDELPLAKTITPTGTTGSLEINTPIGSVNFAASDSSVTVTNSLVNNSSIIIPIVASNDATLTNVRYVATNGAFTIYGNAAATAETKVVFCVL